MKNKKQAKKKITAILLALLTLSGGALALPIDKTSVDDLIYQNLRQLQNNPTQFLRMENFELTEDFDYFKELNKEFVKEFKFEVSEADIKKSLEEGDYESWKEEFLKLGGEEGTQGIISKEEFEVLRQIKSNENSYS